VTPVSDIVQVRLHLGSTWSESNVVEPAIPATWLRQRPIQASQGKKRQVSLLPARDDRFKLNSWVRCGVLLRSVQSIKDSVQVGLELVGCDGRGHSGV
jgi:hypothetical protein